MSPQKRHAFSTSSAPNTVVVTGATAGVGRAVALAFAERGDRVALLARGTAGLAAAAEDVRAAGGIGPRPYGTSRSHWAWFRAPPRRR